MKRKFMMIMMMVLTTVFINGMEIEKEIVLAQRSDVKTLDPQKSIDTISNRVIVAIFDSLYTFNNDLEIVPKIAEKLEQIDDLNTVIKIKEGIKFHNGDEVTAEDVVFSLNRARESAQVGYHYAPITDVKEIDKYTIQIVTEKPFGNILSTLASPAGGIVSKRAVEEYGDQFFQNPVGSGAYKFVEWIAGDRVVLKANKNYFEEKPKSERVVIKNIPEATNRTIALETGEVDMAYDIGIMDIEFLKDHEEVEVIEVEAPYSLYLGFDSSNPMYADKNLRKAIAYAVDNKVLAEYAFQGTATPGTSAVPPILGIHNPDVECYEQNYELAKEYLKKAGYENGLKIELWTSTQSTLVDMATIIQDQLKQINIDVEIVPYEWGAYVSATALPNKALYLLSWNATTMDGDQALYPLFHSEEKGSSGNRSYYENTKVDEILSRARFTMDQKERKELYFEAQEIIQEELPHYTLVYPEYNLGARKAVENLVFKSNGYINYKDIYVKK